MGEIVSIEIKVWWLLLVPFLLLFSLIVIAVIIEKSFNDKLEEKNEKKTLTSWITKKDILYWLLLVCMGAISLFTYQYRGSDEVIGHWGFAGTIVSIILAVVAIGFTLFQTLSSDLSSAKILTSAEKIENASAGLDSTKLQDASDIITKTSENIASYTSKVEEKLEKLTEELLSIKHAQIDSGTKFNELISYYESSSLENNEQGLSKVGEPLIDINSFIDNVFPNLTYMPRFYIFSIFYMYENNIQLIKEKRTFFLKELSKFQLEGRGNEVDLTFPDNIDYLNGANMSSLGASRSFIVRLGILKSYKNLEKEDRMGLLEISEKHIKTIDHQFLHKIKDEISEKF